MEIGPLSEWTAAAAELLAVTVALFLPYYTQVRERRHRRRNLRLVLPRLTLSALRGDPDGLKNLTTFLAIAFLGNADPANDQLLLCGQEISVVLKDPKLDQGQQRQAIEALLRKVGLTLPPKMMGA